MRFILIAVLLYPFVARADDYMLIIKDHQFQPTELTVPAGAKIKLTVANQDATPEEFDSYALNREKVISGHGTATIYIGPLNAGSYPFVGEFHSDTAKGVVIAK